MRMEGRTYCPPNPMEDNVRKTLIVGAAVGVIAAVGLAAPASADTDTSTEEDSTATVYIFHGIPDTPVDVYVDGEVVADDLQPGDFADDLDVDAGTYSVAVTADDAEDDSDPLIGPFDVTVDAGSSYTGVAHLTEDGDATVSVYLNDLSEYADGEGRLAVRHTAAAPAVDVLVDDEVVVEDLTNPNEASYDLEAATVSAAVALAGETDPVIGPADVDVNEGETTIVYAWGSAEDDNLELAVQTLAPESEDDGDNGDDWDHDGWDHHDGDKWDHHDGDKWDHHDGDKWDHHDGDKWDHDKWDDHKDGRH
jgi:hypothetical protein